MTIPGWIKEELKQPLTLLAGIITIFNFIYSLRFITHANIEITGFPISSFPIRMIFFFLLEGLLAYGFGWLIAKLYISGVGLYAFFAFIVELISAWTSIFNVQWIILCSAPSDAGKAVLLILFTFVAFLIACFFIEDHIYENDPLSKSDLSALIFQCIAFIIMVLVPLVSNYKMIL